MGKKHAQQLRIVVREHGLIIGVQSSVNNVFIRGSVVRYVHLPSASVDTALLEDATRRGKILCCCVEP